MNLRALQHVIRSAQALAEGKTIIVLGSASLLASFPELGTADGPLASTYDADILTDPFDELTAIMLHEALGENRAYYQIHGYHADVLRDSITQTFPSGWSERLVTVPDTSDALALSPNDLATVKLLVGRPKDLDLIRILHENQQIERHVIEKLISQLPIPVESMPRVLSHFRGIFP
ncbi:MAG: DUF6036 family nucleotidyltransferase [Luteolibacter sp.]